MKKEYIHPSITVLVTEDICEQQLVNATVTDPTGTKTVDTFKVNNDNNPGGEDNEKWYDDINNWGGD